MKGLEGDGAVGAEIGHLAPGVHPGVGAARADDRHRRLRQPRHRRFQHPLDGGGVKLALPAVIAGAVVFQKEADVSSQVHALWLFWGKIRKIARG